MTFDEKVSVMIKFFESIGPRKAAEFTVHLDEAVKGLGLNNDSLVNEFRRIYTLLLEANHAKSIPAQ